VLLNLAAEYVLSVCFSTPGRYPIFVGFDDAEDRFYIVDQNLLRTTNPVSDLTRDHMEIGN